MSVCLLPACSAVLAGMSNFMASFPVMYRPSHFAENDQARITAFLHAHPFVTLMGSHEGRVAATQVPVVAEEREGTLFLRGHIMRNTDHHKTFVRNPEALVLFSSPHCYVSASWYSQRGTGGSWNYLAVQLRGHIRFLDDAGTLQLLTDLTHRFEDGRPQPELVEHMSDEYINAHIKAIAGFELKAEDIQATFKLSQNRDDESFRNIVRELRASKEPGALHIAALMQQDRPHLFE